MLKEKLRRSGDFVTAGFLEEGDSFLNALVSQLTYAPLPEYKNTHLYPLTRIWGRGIIYYDYSYSLCIDEEALFSSSLLDNEKKLIKDKYDSLYSHGSSIDLKYALAGRGYTHFCPELDSFVNSGINEYFKTFSRSDMLDGRLLKLCEAIESYINRIIEYLLEFNSERSIKIAEEYRRFLKGKAIDFFGAFLRIVFIFALDGFDSLGGVDLVLGKFVPCENAKELFGELYSAFENNNAWNFSLGENDEISILALESYNNTSRPNFSIKIDENTSTKLWNACFDAMKKGARPAFYNKSGYRNEMLKLGVKEADLPLICYGGCSETMIAGKSNVGSIDAGINLAQTLNDCLYFSKAQSFEELLSEYFSLIKKEISIITEQVNKEMLAMKNSRPQYVRTLLCPSCAQNKRDFQSGGAEYTFSVINICALANAADSLYAVKKLVYENKRFSLDQIIEEIKTNFENGYYLSEVRKLEFFGNDNIEVDQIAKEIFDFVCDRLSIHKTAINDGAFLPACIMFDSAPITGSVTDATPDGRKKGESVADSGGAMTGRDNVSPTALLNSVGFINPSRAVGTWVTNLMLNEDMLKNENSKICLRALVLGFFKNGGNQLQITFIDRQKLVDAVYDDELAYNIILRVGGFSERFSNLSREFRKLIVQRTEY